MNARLNHLHDEHDGHPPGPPVTFEKAGPRSGKVRCTVCGRQGYDYGRWKEACLRGHRPCRNGCGRLMSVLNNGAARRHPSHRCPVTNPDIKWPRHAREVTP